MPDWRRLGRQYTSGKFDGWQAQSNENGEKLLGLAASFAAVHEFADDVIFRL
jgi:hypothetical protein